MNVSIVDLNPGRCPEGNCNRLPALLQHCLPTQRLGILTTANCSKHTSSDTDLIVLRPPFCRFDESLARLIEGRSCGSTVFGLFCAGWENREEHFQGIVRHLDDFLLCPFTAVDLRVRIERLFGHKPRAAVSLRAKTLKEKYRLEMLIGESEPFVEVIDKVPPIAASDVTVTILGETGTGKELFARAIHYTSARRDKPFVPINCGALPDQLFENELFGHVRGAFTDASSLEVGLLGVAEGGSLFLDEVDALSIPSQVKLLRFLQDREYRPLGSARTLFANVRIIAATNADLRKQVERKLFREDLFHRLNVLSLYIPTLQDRVADIPALANHLLAKYAAQYGRGVFHFSAGAIQRLTAYSWPGNVRELEGVIQRAIILHPPGLLQARDIDFSRTSERESPGGTNLQQAKARAIVQFERTYLASLLRDHRGNISHAAKAAGKERRSFQRLLHKHGLRGDSFR